MAKRLATCGDCGASVVLTSAAPVIRAGIVVLLCDDCGGRGRRADAAPASDEEEEYEAIVVAPGPEEESSEYEAISISDEDEPRNVKDSSHGESASGSITPGGSTSKSH